MPEAQAPASVTIQPIYVVIPLTEVNELRTLLKKTLHEANTIAHVHRARECIEAIIQGLLKALPSAADIAAGTVQVTKKAPAAAVPKPGHIVPRVDTSDNLTPEQIAAITGSAGDAA
jgi:hypothetical protein